MQKVVRWFVGKNIVNSVWRKTGPNFLSVEKSGKYHQSCIRGGGGFEAEDAEGGLVGGRLEFCFQIILIFL